MAETNLDAVAKMLAAAETDNALESELTSAKDLATVVQIGKDRGYNFSAEDFQAVASACATETDELSDDDLENVAGGNFQSLYNQATSTASSMSKKAHGMAMSVIRNI